MLPSPDILNEYEYGKFVLSNLAAKRARQLREGAMPLIQVDSHHPLTIALAEIAAGKIKPIIPTSDADEYETSELSLISDEPLTEFGMLLPALEEHEIQLVETVLVDHADDHHDEEGVPAEPKPLGLSDLVDAHDEEPEEAPVASEDDTLSLSDIADQESAEEEEQES